MLNFGFGEAKRTPKYPRSFNGSGEGGSERKVDEYRTPGNVGHPEIIFELITIF